VLRLFKPLAITLVDPSELQRAVGTEGSTDWKMVYEPYRPSGKEVRALLTANTLKSGSLIGRVKEA
jgi:hypothetical protein